MNAVDSIDDIQQKLISDFELFDDWNDKYAYIIELGKQLKPLDSKYKIEENKIKGCQSQVWLHSHLEDGKVVFEADSDAIIVKGLVSMLVKVYSNQSPDEILNHEAYFIDQIGMSQHLSITRSNGLASMIKQMKLNALAYKAQQ